MSKAKQAAAEAAIKYIEDGMVVGVGTGSTVNYFIEALAKERDRIDGAVASSLATREHLKSLNIPIIETNAVSTIDLYVDGADEATKHLQLIKGGGAALTGEKVVRAMSRRFVCIIDDSKLVDVLGTFPLPVEVIPLARSYVAREMVKIGGDPAYREETQTDYGNIILDVYNLKILDPIEMEAQINQIPGVVTNGLFAKNGASTLLVGHESGEVTKLQ